MNNFVGKRSLLEKCQYCTLGCEHRCSGEFNAPIVRVWPKELDGTGWWCCRRVGAVSHCGQSSWWLVGGCRGPPAPWSPWPLPHYQPSLNMIAVVMVVCGCENLLFTHNHQQSLPRTLVRWLPLWSLYFACTNPLFSLPPGHNTSLCFMLAACVVRLEHQIGLAALQTQ